jgi:hypothetical protein
MRRLDPEIGHFSEGLVLQKTALRDLCGMGGRCATHIVQALDLPGSNTADQEENALCGVL